MQVPLELTFRNVESSEELESFIEQQVEKLERFCDHISGCRIAVEQPHKHASSRNPYRVRIDITVPPQHEVVVSKDPADNPFDLDLKGVLRGAFQAAERQLKEVASRQRGEVKSRVEPVGFVVTLDREEGFGFLKTPDGQEVYFHRNAVTNDDFERLEIGTQVRFTGELGEKGPQASTVQVIDKPGAREKQVEEEVFSKPPGWE